jgi:Uma2 family endonuclease
MSNAAIRRMTVPEFLEWDSGDDRTYELRDGVVVAMAPSSRAHNIIVGELGFHLRRALEGRKGCTVEPQAGIRSRSRPNSFYVCDLAVTCTPPLGGEKELAEPTLVVEVFSPSTDRTDRHVKLPDYRLIPSVQEILLFQQDFIHCEVHRRLDQSRWLTDLVQGPEQKLRIESIGIEIPLGELYREISFPSCKPA